MALNRSPELTYRYLLKAGTWGGHFWPLGHNLNKLGRSLLGDTTYLGLVVSDFFMFFLYTHPGSGSDRTIASVRQVTALAMLYIGRLVTCGIDYSFTH